MNELATPPWDEQTTTAQTTSTETESASIESAGSEPSIATATISEPSAVEEPINENVEVDTARDKKLGIKKKSERSLNQEKAYVQKIKAYEEEIAQEMIEG